MLDSAITSIFTALTAAVPDGVEVSYNSPDTRRASWLQVIVASAPVPFTEFSETNGHYTADITVALRAKVTGAADGGRSVIHRLIESTIRALNTLKPEGAENFVQNGASEVGVEGENSENIWYRCDLNYTLTLDYLQL